MGFNSGFKGLMHGRGAHRDQLVSLTYTTTIMRSFYEFGVSKTCIAWTLGKCLAACVYEPLT